MSRQPNVWQVMECLDVGDAVSLITVRNARILKEAGYNDKILTVFQADDVKHLTMPYDQAEINEDDSVLFHFWNLSRLEDWIKECPGKKALYYHNITPPKFFLPGTAAYQHCKSGYDQLLRMISSFDLFIGVSNYNIMQLRKITDSKSPGLSVHPVFDESAVMPKTMDEELYREVKSRASVNFLFFGRLAPNKCQSDIIDVFEYYNYYINRDSALYLVGNDQCGDYAEHVRNRSLESPVADRIFITGKVSDTALGAYLEAASVFLCMSEHEGFCLPLIMAMKKEIPVFAYSAAAVPETMGGSGVLLLDKRPDEIAELIHVVLSDDAIRMQLVGGQNKRISLLSEENAKKRLLTAIQYLQSGQLDSSCDYWMQID